MLDVSKVEDINIDDEVVLFGYEKDCPTVEEVASKLGTISYEVVCMVGRRIPRVYIQNGEVVKTIDYLLD